MPKSDNAKRTPERTRRQSSTTTPGSERARDEQRDGGPRYGGGPWELADERAPDERFGRARNDDSDPSEVEGGDDADDTSPSAADPELARAEAAAEIESGGEREGMRRPTASRGPRAQPPTVKKGGRSTKTARAKVTRQRKR
jgi:hypothetical protein